MGNRTIVNQEGSKTQKGRRKGEEEVSQRREGARGRDTHRDRGRDTKRQQNWRQKWKRKAANTHTYGTEISTWIPGKKVKMATDRW